MRYDTFGVREVQIFRRTDRGEIDIISTLKAESLAAALMKFKEGYLQPKGFTDFMRTGNVISAVSLDGEVLEWAARDKPALL